MQKRYATKNNVIKHKFVYFKKNYSENKLLSSFFIAQNKLGLHQKNIKLKGKLHKLQIFCFVISTGYNFYSRLPGIEFTMIL